MFILEQGEKKCLWSAVRTYLRRYVSGRCLWHIVIFLHLNLAFDLGPIVNYIIEEEGK
jgi:hypothetical protein